jgi:dihydrolipoamide dehydrogenase
MPAVVARKDKVAGTLRGGLEKTCSKLKVNLVHGKAKVVSANLVRVHTSEGEEQEITGDKVIIATGSRNLNLPSLPVDHKKIISSDDALELDHVPERLLVVGGGVIGSELACIFQSFGSKVTIVEGLDRILPLPSIDREISKLMQRELKKRKISCEVCRTAVKAEYTDSGVAVTLGPSPFLDQVPAAAEKEKVVEADAVLVSVGRVPNTEGLGLAEAGVETDAKGWIIADEYCRTSQPGIYAIGDVLGPSKVMLAHAAVMEGLVAARNCLGRNEVMTYDVMPSAVFTSPEVASVGMTEEQAAEQGWNVRCVQSQFRELGKAQAMGEISGVFKLVVDADSGKLLGAHLAGAHVSDIIAEPTLALRLGAAGKDIARTIHAHPTLAEGLFEAAHML